MRVLHIDTGREMRGGQWQALYLMEGLSQIGQAAVFAGWPETPLFNAAAERGFEALPLSWAALRSPADLVHAHDARAHTLAALLPGRPLVVARRVAFPIRKGIASRWKYGRAAHFIAVSEFVKRKTLEAGIAAEKVSVVYDGVPLPEPGTSGSLVVAPATADPQKGSELLQRAASIAGVEVRFSSGLAEDLRSARVFVYITREEGLGSAALLAMAAGVPVIASRVGGLTEVVVDGETGVLVENQPEAITAALRRLNADPELCRRLGEAGRRRVEERFTVDKMVRETIAVYRRVLAC